MDQENGASLSQQEKPKEKPFEAYFPHAFVHQNQTFWLETRPFGSRPNEKWIQVIIIKKPVTNRVKEMFRKSQPTEVGTLTLKFPAKPDERKLEIMGNYNHTFGEKDPVKGVVGASVEEVAELTGFELLAGGLTQGGDILYSRMSEKHRSTITVEENNGKYLIKRSGSNL